MTFYPDQDYSYIYPLISSTSFFLIYLRFIVDMEGPKLKFYASRYEFKSSKSAFAFVTCSA